MGNDFEVVRSKIREFDAARGWGSYNAKDLVIALTSEVGELAECYQWLSNDEIASAHSNEEKKQKIASEIADVFIYLVKIADSASVDMMDAFEKKLAKINERYPVEKMKGRHNNPLEGYKVSEVHS